MMASPLLLSSSPLLGFLVKRFAKDKQPVELDQNRWYAAELLAFILGLPVDRIELAKQRLINEGAIDALLKSLSAYRRRDPASPDEGEFMENLFLSLDLLLSSPVGQDAFLEGEGVELMCLILKEKRQAKPAAVTALDYALLGAAGRPACDRFVDAGGLASLFSAFMGKAAGKGKKAAAQTHTEMDHILSLISSLWTSLESDSPARLRLLTKFVEKEYEKVDRLVELRAELAGRMEKAEQEAEDEDEDEDDKYLSKLEGGLGGLQQVDYILAWLCMEDDGVSTSPRLIISLDRRTSPDLSALIRAGQGPRCDAPLARVVVAARSGQCFEGVPRPHRRRRRSQPAAADGSRQGGRAGGGRQCAAPAGGRREARDFGSADRVRGLSRLMVVKQAWFCQ